MHGSSGEHSFLQFSRSLTLSLSRRKSSVRLSVGDNARQFLRRLLPPSSPDDGSAWTSATILVFFLPLLPLVLLRPSPPPTHSSAAFFFQRLALPLTFARHLVSPSPSFFLYLSPFFFLLHLPRFLVPSQCSEIISVLFQRCVDRPLSNPPSRTMKPKIFSGTRGMRRMITYIEPESRLARRSSFSPLSQPPRHTLSPKRTIPRGCPSTETRSIVEIVRRRSPLVLSIALGVWIFKRATWSLSSLKNLSADFSFARISYVPIEKHRVFQISNNFFFFFSFFKLKR